MKRFSKIMISMLIIAVMICQMFPFGAFVSAASASGEPTYEYKAVQTITPGKTYIIGDGGSGAGQKVNIVGVPDNIAEREVVSYGSVTTSSGYTISDFEGSEKYEWTAVAGMGENSGLPSTVMFQNPQTGAWLYNAVYDVQNSADVSMMTITLNPMEDDYTGYTRQIFNTQAAKDAYTEGKNGGAISLSPNWIVLHSTTTSGDRQSRINLGDLSSATYPYVGLVGHENATDTAVFEFYVNQDVSLGYSTQNKFAEHFDRNWTAKQFPGDINVPGKPATWNMLRFDINDTSNQIFVSSVFAAKNAHAFTALKSFRRSIAWFSSNNGFQPSNRFPFAQFAISSGSYTHTVGQWDTKNTAISNTAGYADQFYYGWTDGIFYATWNNSLNVNNSVFYEKTEVEAGNFEWQLVTDASQLESGAEYIIASYNGTNTKGVAVINPADPVNNAITNTQNKNYYENAGCDAIKYSFEDGKVTSTDIVDEAIWVFHKIGDYYLIANKGTGNNLRTTSDYSGVKTMPQAATGGAQPYAVWYRWQYDFENNDLVVFNHPQNEGEALASKALKASSTQGNLSFSPSTEYPVYLYKKVYVEPEACAHAETKVINVKAATCAAEGYTGDTVCASCGELISAGTTIPKTAHGEQVLANVVEATCKNEGYTGDTVCSVCGYVFAEGTKTPVTDHTPGDELYYYVAPTCTGEGWSGNRYCTVCDEGLPGEVLKPLGHDHQAVKTVKPTCTEGGYTVYECTRCGDTQHWDQKDSLGHSYSEVVTAPTCTAGGYTTYTCTVCGDSYVGNETPKLDHSYEANVTKPTCTAGGFTSYTCSVCGDGYVSDEVSPLGHAYVETTVEATCTADGSITNVCSACGDTVTQTIPAKGHTEVIDEAKAPTCTETGLTEGKHCSVCGEVLVAQTVVDALGHEEVIDEAVEPTCTETGLTEGKHCSVCDAVIVAQVVVPAKGHTEVIDEAVEPTCTETGLTEGKHCSVCGEVLLAQTVVPSKGHSYDAVVTAPDCENGGYTTYTCSVCNDSYVSDETEATGHAYEIIDRRAPAVNVDGYEMFECENCGDSYTEVLPALSEIYLTIYDENGEVVSREGYTTLGTAANDAAGKTAVIDILADITLYDAVILKGDITINAGGNTVTSSARRVFRIADSGTTVEMNDVNIVSTANRVGSNDVRGISVDTDYEGIELTLNNCSVDFTGNGVNGLSFAVNGGGSNEIKLTISGGSYEGANAVNLHGNDHVVTIENAVLTSLYAPDDTYLGAGIRLEGTGVQITVTGTTVNGAHAVAFSSKEEADAELDITDNTKRYTVRVDTEYFYTFREALAAAEEGSNIHLLQTAVIDGATIIDNVTITANANVNPAIRIVDGAVVEINNVTMDTENYNFILGASDASSAGYLRINGGKYHAGTTAVSVTKGELVINDGEFSVDPYEGSYAYLINCIDKYYNDGSAAVKILGGKFHNWNPADNAAEGTGTSFVVEGFHGVSIGETLYAVEAHNVVIDEAVAPTCTETGLTEGSHCDVCGEVLVAQEVVPVAGHSYDAVVTAPDCENSGYTTYTCSVCGDSYVADETAANGHRYSSVAVTPATCTEAGYITITCGDCDAVFVSGVDAEADQYLIDYPFFNLAPKGHTEVIDEAVEPTCTETGLTEGKHCSVCGEVLLAQTVVPSKGHSYDAVVTAPDCENGGYTTYTCSACGDSYIADEVDKLGHSYESIEKVEASAGKEGYEIFECSACGDSYTLVIPALENIYVTFYDTDGNMVMELGYESLADAVSEYAFMYEMASMEGEVNGVIDILADVVLEEALIIETDVTVNGNGNTVTSSASRVFRIAGNGTTVEMNDVNVVSDAVRTGTNDIRGISIDNNCEGISLTLNNCSVDFTDASASDWSYAVNNTINKGTTIEINGGSYEGANVINVWGEGAVVAIDGATLTSIYGVNDMFVGVGIKLEGTNIDFTVTNTTVNGSHAVAFDQANDGNTVELDITDNTKQYKVKADGQYYYTIEDAIEQSADGATITLIRDVSCAEKETFDLTGRTLDLNGNVLITGQLKGLLAGQNFTVTNGTIDGEGASYGLWIGDYNSVIATDNALFENIDVIGGANLLGATNITFRNCSVNVNNETNSRWYAVCVQYGSCVIESGTYISGINQNKRSPAVIGIGTSEITIKGGEYSTDVIEYCEDGYHSIENEAGLYAVGAHDYETVVTAPTCTEDGYTTYTCSGCGDSYVADEVEASGHNYEADVNDPTCTEGGYTTYTCSACGDSYVADETVANDHRYSSVAVTPATCTEAGYITITCGDCGAVFVSGVDAEADQYLIDNPYFNLAPKGHTEVIDEAVEPTCTETGLTEGSHCDVCGEVLVAQEVVPVAGHSYDAVVTEPTCLEGGYTTYTCANCGDSYVADETAAKGHRYSSVAVTSATCTEAGYITITCGNCGGVFVSGVDAEADQYLIDNPYFNLAPKGHTEVIDEAVEATCTETGLTEGSHCEVCGEVLVAQEVVPATGHRYSTVDVTSATCTEAGYITITCGNCGGVFVSGVDAEADQYLIDYPYFNLAPKGHTEVIDEAVEPTCTETGLTEGSHCEVCGEVLVAQEVVPAKGHSYEETVEDATCTETGLITNICSVCGDTVTEVIPAKGHAYKATAIVNATCTEDGYTVLTCANCGDVVEGTIPATGHSYEAVVTEPTCTEGGYTTYTCPDCGDSYVTDETAAKGHRYSSVAVTPATCTEAGYITITCGDCDAVFVSGVDAEADQYLIDYPFFNLAPKGHTEVIDEAVEATCTETGLTEGSHCEVCGETLVAQEVVAAKGHRFSKVAVTSATCTEDGYVTITCGDCGKTFVSGVDAEADQYLIDNPYFKLEATGHDVVIDEAVAPTEDSTGLTEGSHCANCGEVFVAQEEIPVVVIGDVNGDGKVNAKDQATLKLYLSGVKEEVFLEFNADMDGDGDISAKDMVLLKKKLVK